MIEVKELSFGYKEKQILQNIQMSTDKAKMIGIIGPNGSGKSTLLKCIYRVLQPQSGAIFLDGKNVLDYSLKESAKKMAVVAQHHDSSFDFRVIEMVLMGRSPHKKLMEPDNQSDKEMAMEALERVDMKNFADRSFSSLSGGEKQRIVLARALVQDTPYLVLDEPTNHLDIKHQLHFMKIAKELKATVVSAIHDLNIAAMYCDQIVALKDGKILDMGPPEKVLTTEMIQTLYGVKAKMVKDQGRGYILFDPE